jgi:hypothetical protein
MEHYAMKEGGTMLTKLWSEKPKDIIRETCYRYGEEIRKGFKELSLYPQKLALTSPTSGGSSVGIFRLWTKTTE